MSSSGNDLFAGLSLAPPKSASNGNSNNNNNSSDAAFHSSSPSLGYTPPAPPPPLLRESKSQPVVPVPVLSSSSSKSIPLPAPTPVPSVSAAAPVRNAPVTDKLLTLLGDSGNGNSGNSGNNSGNNSQPPPLSPSPTRTASVATVTPTTPLSSSPPPRFAPAAKHTATKKRASKAAIGTKTTTQSPVADTTKTTTSSTDVPEPMTTTTREQLSTPKSKSKSKSKSERKPERKSEVTGTENPSEPAPAAPIPSAKQPKPAALPDETPAKASVGTAAAADASPDAPSPPTSTSTSTPTPSTPSRPPSGFSPKPRSLSVVEDETTNIVDAKQRSSLRGVGVIKDDTPVPNCDVALRVLRKFAQKTKPHVPESHGGTQPLSLWARYVSGTPTEYDTRFDAYRQFVEAVASESGDSGSSSSSSSATDAVVESVLGASGDTMNKAKAAMASFCHLMSVWGHASTILAERTEQKGAEFRDFCAMVSTGFDTATSLVTHGCLDGVLIGIGPGKDEFHKAADVLAESVFSVDLSQPASELSAVKFLLSTGCRIDQQHGEALLRGTHLLQTIRVLYHVFLSTPVEANKTTARASLQQLVTSVFIRMIAASNSASDSDSDNDETENGEQTEQPAIRRTSSTDSDAGPWFPSDNHRDAFLVLRSLCKLSMRAPPTGDKHSHTGLQTSGSNAVWDSSKDPTGRSPAKPTRSSSSGGYEFRSGSSGKKGGGGDTTLQHVYTHAIHPALESKILALDLLLYVLKRSNMTGSFLQGCGPQFHFAIRNYLCVSLLKNCTSENTTVVKLSLLVFVPIFQNFRSILKAEIEAFVTNVFFVILDSKNSPMEHKSLVVTLFNEICSDPTTLAEIFLNYDCDLSAVDLFHRIINTLSRVARTTDLEATESSSTVTSLLVTGQGGTRMERIRTQHRELRLNAMRALRQVLASLNASIVEPMPLRATPSPEAEVAVADASDHVAASASPSRPTIAGNGRGSSRKTLVEIYDDKKKRREEDSEIVLRFNQKPKAGIAYATKCGHIDSSDPADVARFLHKNKDRLEKTQIGEYLGREPECDNGMAKKILHQYVDQMDFDGLVFDKAIRYFLSKFRLPGEAQKIDRILDKFAQRYSEQNPDAFPSADVAFTLSFSTIMLNTDLHNPSIKEERKMTKEGFIRNNRGICDGQDMPREMLVDIFDRIRENPISLKEDDDARERAAGTTRAGNALSPAVFFTNHYDEMDRTKESNFTKERDQIVRTTESLLRRWRHGSESGKAGQRRGRTGGYPRSPHLRYVRTGDSGLRDEYVAPMFEVTWGPALAAFSTAMESANGTVGALLAIATDEELEAAAINAAETIEVCLTGFRFAICTAGLVGNDVARESFMIALSRFSQLGTGVLLEPRHVRCIQTMLVLARSDGELLGASWEHIFKALSEINRFHQLFQLMARNDRVVARAAERRKSRLVAREKRREEKDRRRAQKEESESLDNSSTVITDDSSDGGSSYDSSLLFDESDDLSFNDDMDAKEIDEANARTVYEAVAEDMIEAIYERSSSLSTSVVKEFILQLCRVSRMEISDYGGFVGSDSNEVSLTSVQYRKKHDLLANSVRKGKEGFHHHQTNIYNLQKLVEVTHYNMDSRPRLVFNELWTMVSASLTSTALHSNPAVAMYAVDSFRQLCIQYLQREELGVFEFQRRFLKPLETVMARSEISTTKELLLRCVERIILMFGSPQEGNGGGKLRSGWRPVLKVLGLAGRDSDEEIAKMGFEMLNAQILLCLDQCKAEGEFVEGQGILLVERFVDLVDALLIYVGGPHEEMSLQSIDDLLKLCDFLADESTVSPLLKKRRSVTSSGAEGSEESEASSNEELELWWPILLGLSRSVGDSRKKIRQKSLESLTKIVSSYFFPSEEQQEALDDNSKSKYIQTLQLVYRGIFSPVLEFGDETTPNTKVPSLPSDMDRFLSGKTSADSQKSDDSKQNPSWIDTTYDRFIDDCVHICIRSMKVFSDDTLIEDVFAMFNSCLISESGALAVKGLRRLEIFVTSDLPTGSVSDATWATVSHMLRRSLRVRGLPKKPSSTSLNGSSGAASDGKPKDKSESEPEAQNPELEQQEMVREFVAEDNMLIERRFIGSNAISVIGKFMETERFKKSMSLRWRLFLISGMGRAIRDWEVAAGIIAKNPGKSNDAQRINPPSYVETAYYGRKWMNRFLLQVAAMKEMEGTAVEGTRQEAAQDVIKEQTQALVSAFLAKEAVVNGEGKKLSWDMKSFDKLMNLVQDMLAGYTKLTDEHLKQMSWLNPVLSSCIHTSNEDIRLAIQKLVERLH